MNFGSCSPAWRISRAMVFESAMSLPTWSPSHTSAHSAQRVRAVLIEIPAEPFGSTVERGVPGRGTQLATLTNERLGQAGVRNRSPTWRHLYLRRYENGCRQNGRSRAVESTRLRRARGASGRRKRPGSSGPPGRHTSASNATLELPPLRRPGEAQLAAVALPGPIAELADADSQVGQAASVLVAQGDAIHRARLGTEAGPAHLIALPIAPAGARVRLLVTIAVHLGLGGRRALELRRRLGPRSLIQARAAVRRPAVLAVLADGIPGRALLLERQHADPSHVAVRLIRALGVR